MSLEAWQAQQKAQKDEEKMRKTQAAEALRSYKGDAANAEASKLTQLKEQDRQRKLEAERKLREYRGTISEDDAKLTAYKEEERRKKQEAATMLRGYQGSLSEEEARLAAMREEEKRRRQEAHKSLLENLDSSWSDVQYEEGDAISPGSVSAMKGLFSGMSGFDGCLISVAKCNTKHFGPCLFRFQHPSRKSLILRNKEHRLLPVHPRTALCRPLKKSPRK